MSEKRPNHRPPKERTLDPAALTRDYYTIYETADLLKLHHNTIRRGIKSGAIPAVQIGRQWRIKKADLDAITDTSK